MASAKIGNELKMRQSTKTEETTTDEDLEAFVARAFIAAGLPDADAQTVAGLMVEADLRGSDTHGVIRLPLYVRRLRAGGINAKANIRVINESASVALIDGDNAMGHLVMHEAALLAIEKAKATGIGWVGARMSNHAGPAALYVTQPLDHDMIGLYFAVGSNNHLPPWGGMSLIIALLAGALNRAALGREVVENRQGNQYRPGDHGAGGRGVHAARAVQKDRGWFHPRHSPVAPVAGRRAHLASR